MRIFSIKFFLLLFLVFLGSCKSEKQPKAQTTTNPTALYAFFQQQLETNTPLVSAHRGGKVYKEFPENCIETFDFVLAQNPALIECDIALTKDSILVLMHDNTIDRTTTGSGMVTELTYRELQQFNLVDNYGTPTDFKIPTLEEVLRWAKDKAILTLDIKRSVPYESVVDLVEKMKAENYALIITYNDRAAKKIYSLNPNLLLSVSIRNKEELQRHLDSGIPVANMIAFTGTKEPNPELYQQLHATGIPCILGTLGNLDKSAQARGDQLYQTFIRNGADILATDRPIEAAKAIQSMIPEKAKYEPFFKN